MSVQWTQTWICWAVTWGWVAYTSAGCHSSASAALPDFSHEMREWRSIHGVSSSSSSSHFSFPEQHSRAEQSKNDCVHDAVEPDTRRCALLACDRNALLSRFIKLC
ncbi:hypothetical protein C4D60_Mb04t34450 [Musa balbisiana]|uniref:Secreted protein n=1 Tax=Musa balbisiana TaxID=52838 RepID=A0A4S8KGQ5_MUSBA|nr:hypothetical protein C4D60_Mb04t34450 [Musa balbisiana]